MTRTTRRETNRLRAEIMEGLAEYMEDRERETRIHCADRERTDRIGRCGTIIRDVPGDWLRALVLAASPYATYLPEFRFVLTGPRTPQPFFLH